MLFTRTPITQSPPPDAQRVHLLRPYYSPKTRPDRRWSQVDPFVSVRPRKHVYLHGTSGLSSTNRICATLCTISDRTLSSVSPLIVDSASVVFWYVFFKYSFTSALR